MTGVEEGGGGRYLSFSVIVQTVQNHSRAWWTREVRAPSIAVTIRAVWDLVLHVMSLPFIMSVFFLAFAIYTTKAAREMNDVVFSSSCLQP